MRVLLVALLIAACGGESPESCSQFGFGFGFRGGRHMPRRVRGGSVDVANLFQVAGNGTTSYLDTADIAVTDDVLVGTRLRCNTQTAGRVLISKDDGSVQRNSFMDLNTCAGGVCSFRAVQCQTLSACAQTRLTNASVMNGNPAMVAYYLDHTNALMIPYVNGAANLISNTNAIPAAPTDGTAVWTIGAANGGAGTTEADCDFDDSFLIVSPRMSSGVKPTALQVSTCMYDFWNRGGSRTWPMSCPDYAQTIAAGGRMTLCRGGDDNGGSGTTCSNYFAPGSDDWVLHNTSYEASTIDNIVTPSSLTTNNPTRIVGMCVGQSNCGSTANVLADLDSPTPGQTDNYPNYLRFTSYWNNGMRDDGTTTPQPIDFSTELEPTFIRFNDVGTGYTNDTTDCTNATDNDCSLMPAAEATGDYLLIAFSSTARFDRLRFDRAGATVGVGGACAWEYCSAQTAGSCDTWTAVSGLSDATSCFTAAAADNQIVSFTHPSNWVPVTEDSVSNYYLRARVTTLYTTNPTADEIRFLPQSAVYSVSADTNARVSPLVPLCDELLETFTNKDCGMVNASRGGSEISGLTASTNWMPQFGAVTRLFGEAMSRVTTANLDANAEVVYLMKYQGEAEINASNPLGTLPADWHTFNHRYRVVAELDGYRDQLVALSVPGGRGVPICVVVPPPTEPPTGYDAAEWDYMREGLVWAAGQVNDTVVVQVPDGYAISGDEVHINSAGADFVGRACADALETTRLFALLTP